MLNNRYVKLREYLANHAKFTLQYNTEKTTVGATASYSALRVYKLYRGCDKAFAKDGILGVLASTMADSYDCCITIHNLTREGGE